MRAMIHAADCSFQLVTGYPAVRPLPRRANDSIYGGPECNSNSGLRCRIDENSSKSHRIRV